MNLAKLFKLHGEVLTATLEWREDHRRPGYSLMNAVVNEILTQGEGLIQVEAWVNYINDPNSWGRDHYDVFRISCEDQVISIPAPVLIEETCMGLLRAARDSSAIKDRTVAEASQPENIWREHEGASRVVSKSGEGFQKLWNEFIALATDRQFLHLRESERTARLCADRERRMIHGRVRAVA